MYFLTRDANPNWKIEIKYKPESESEIWIADCEHLFFKTEVIKSKK